MHLKSKCIGLLLFFQISYLGALVAPLAYTSKGLEQKGSAVVVAHRLLNRAPFREGSSYAITSYELAELKVESLIDLFDTTQTAFGFWGLQQLTKPVTDYSIIKKRQEAIAQYDADPVLIDKMHKLLTEINSHQEQLLAYYQDHDQLNEMTQELYYKYLFPQALNKSKLALDCSYIFEAFNALKSLALTIGANGLLHEFACAQAENRSVNLFKGFLGGFHEMFNSHSLSDKDYQKSKAAGEFNIPASDSKLRNVWNNLTSTGSVKTVMRGTLGDRWSYAAESYHLPSPIAFLWAVGQVAYADYSFSTLLISNYKRLVFIYNVYEMLQKRLMLVAQCMHAMEELIELVDQIPALKEHGAVKDACALLHDQDGSLHELLMQLRALYKSNQKILYSRGQALITHALMQKIKIRLLPILQAVGVIDGFVSICDLYHTHKNDTQNRFCFAQFVDAEQPLFELQDGWLPLVKNSPIHNSLSLGSDVTNAHLLLSGPSGSGKSTCLKLVGNTVVLAQSWGIVPATTCRMTLFDGLRTSFNPQEDIERNISTFMAQQERLSALETFIKQSNQQGHYMLLIDEPYRGIIEAEAERRVYALCKVLAQSPSCMMIVASHLRTPLDLEQEMHIFVNKHLEVQPQDDGTFVRTFTLVDGAAWWWFNDLDQRMRFVDWLYTCCPQDV